MSAIRDHVIQQLTYLHDFFSAHPAMLPFASDRIGLTLNEQGELNPLPLENPQAMENVMLNRDEVASLYTYLRHYYTNGDTCMMKLSQGRQVKVTVEMMRHELATIQWLGTNVGRGFVNDTERNFG